MAGLNAAAVAANIFLAEKGCPQLINFPENFLNLTFCFEVNVIEQMVLDKKSCRSKVVKIKGCIDLT